MFSSRGAAASSARWRAIVGRSLRTAGPVCTSAGGGGVECLGGGLGQERFENVEGQARAADDAFADGVHGLTKLQAKTAARCTLARQAESAHTTVCEKTAGEGFECGTRGVIGFEEEGICEKIHAAPFGEGLQRIEDGAACMGGKRIERHAPRSMGDDGSCRQGAAPRLPPRRPCRSQRSGICPRRPAVPGLPSTAFRRVRRQPPPCGVAGEQLYQLQAASGDGLRQCFGKVSAADDHYAFQRSLHIVLQ